MSNMPDPSYWGNPPRTPTKNSSVDQHSNSAPQNPYVPPSHPDGRTSAQAPFDQQHNQSGSRTKKKHGCLIAGIIAVIAAIVLFIVCCVACVNLITENLQDQHHDQYFDLPSATDPDDGTLDNSSTLINNRFFRDAFDMPSGSDPISSDELEELQDSYFSDTPKDPDEEGSYMDGVYFIGRDIPAGTYWFTGNDEELSYFFILEPEDESDLYNVDHINSYYGHNIMKVEEGEVLILVNDGKMIPLDQFDGTFRAPYESGTYRVGIDVPAGTYRLQLGEADDYGACYVMSDLDFTEESYLFEAYYIDGDEPDEITLENGTYIELYNMTMTPVMM